MKFMLLAAALVMAQADGTPQIDIEPVTEGVWRHVSYRDLGGAQLTPSNGLVVETPVGLVLVDTAWGEAETAHLLTVLERQFGQRVIAAIVTHAHPDHIWGLLDDFGDLLFADARYLMGRAEWDYWWNPQTVATIGAGRQAFAVGAKRRRRVKRI